MGKCCSRCKEIKPLDEFYLRGDRKGKTGRMSHCAACVYTQTSKYSMKPFLDWVKHIRTEYGITPCQYAEMFSNQAGKCAVCGGAETTPGRRRLAVDHNHDTGQIRGLLCSGCNIALGSLDTPQLLATACVYLTQSRDGAPVVPATLVKKVG